MTTADSSAAMQEVRHYRRVPLLTDSQVGTLSRLNEQWSDLWTDIEELARRVHAAAERDDLRVEFHHLLLAVVNFKAERMVVPPSMGAVEPSRGVTAEERDELLIPFGAHLQIRLSAKEPGSWRLLANSVRGFGPPRTTTLLAALWPQEHAIMDWRALSVACALVGTTTGWDKTPVENGGLSGGVKIDWPNYDWYRKVILEEAKAHARLPADVERAFYQLARRVESVPGRSWEGYARRVLQALAALE